MALPQLPAYSGTRLTFFVLWVTGIRVTGPGFSSIVYTDLQQLLLRADGAAEASPRGEVPCSLTAKGKGTYARSNNTAGTRDLC